MRLFTKHSFFALVAMTAGTAGLSGLTACSFSPEAGTTESALAGCGEGNGVAGLVCGIGQSDGRLAVSFNGKWFALAYADGNWTLTNDVVAEPANVTPFDERVEKAAEWCPCGGPGQDNTRQCYIEQCGGPRPPVVTTETRTFTATLGDVEYTVKAKQVIEDNRVRARELDNDLRMTRNLVFEVTASDPVDRNPWTVIVLPKRAASGVSGSQDDINEKATSPGAGIERGESGGLFETGNVDYLPEVELGSAVKKAASLAPEMIARSNVALNRALEAAMPGGGDAFQDHVVPEAIRSTGTVLDKVTGPGGATSVFDLKRVSQFYMDTRRGQEGWSAGDGAERPMAETRPHEWRFRHNVFAHDVYFPFLAGICGFEAHLHSYVAGSLTYGKKSCFDGLATNIDARGNLELAMSGGGGLGCNILVASAAAGLEASVRAAAEFSTSLSTAPPRLSAAVDLYSELAYSAFFRVRVLFWSKKWEKRLGGVRLFQKHAGIDFAPVGDPGLALCDAGADQGGDCEDSTASCDVTGRCVRYDFSSPGPSGEPKRVDVGACMLAPGGPQNRPFDIAIDTRQFIPSAIPGVASQEGRICPSTVLAGAVIPQGLPIDPQGAIALWTKEGLGMNATKTIFPEPYPVPAGIDVWFSGDSRMPTTRPDVTRRVGIHWNGRVKFYDGDGPILQDASYGSNGDASFQFLPNGCLVNAGHATLLPSMLPGPTTKATHPNAEYYVEAKYPLNPFAPTIKQKLSVTSFGVGNGNGEMTFLVKTRHTKLPWHEPILRWGGEQYGLRNWQSACPGPSIGAFNNFVNDQVWVRLGYQNGKKRVWVGEDALDGPWTEVSPNGWGQTITGTPAGCN